ncbi:hypothetical protein BEL04_19280 [Mucilaginibacter sp. PPCGB 2223]|uniref:hypothetical protein n=1 Tax=Mucilaginibacter sp. PPCGB 2223 TaxID=1886027 RepID=UPI000825BC75|nr:hypothetical protein [Mucilaginibacter sp. PPCGB 2223]OCX50869.1 hypothetical protein BEL04_19280 [Mucilaginibacter sp. PPCGB 2223]
MTAEEFLQVYKVDSDTLRAWILKMKKGFQTKTSVMLFLNIAFYMWIAVIRTLQAQRLQIAI